MLKPILATFSALVFLLPGCTALHDVTRSEQDLPLAQRLNKLATERHALGRYAEAESLNQQVVAILEKIYGPNHLIVVAMSSNLAETYLFQCKYAQAGLIYHRNLETLEKAFGSEHPWLAVPLIDLAEAYQLQGKFIEAESFRRRALTIWERTAEAEATQQQVTTGLERTLGPDHPSVGRSVSTLALIYEARKSYNQAERAHNRALTIFEKWLGPEHHVVATTLENYSGLLRQMGKDTEAKEMEARAKAIRAARHRALSFCPL